MDGTRQYNTLIGESIIVFDRQRRRRIEWMDEFADDEEVSSLKVNQCFAILFIERQK